MIYSARKDGVNACVIRRLEEIKTMPIRKTSSKKAGGRLSPENDDKLREKLGFAKDNLRTPDPVLQRSVIDSLGFAWSYEKPPEDLSDDVLWAKVALMCIVGAGGGYPEYGEYMRHHAVNTIWDCVDGYAKKCIHEYAKSYVNTGSLDMNAENVSAMLSEEWIAAATYIHTYDPDRAAPLTFLKQCFIHGIFEWKKKKTSIGANSSVTGLTKRVAHVKSQLESEGKEITLQTLHDEMPGVSLDSIQTALITLEASQNMASLEACAELLESRASTIPGPEETVLMDEKNAKFYNAVKRLPKEEQAAYCLTHGIDITDCSVSLEPQTAVAVSKLMSIPQGRVTFLLSRAEQDLYTYLTGHRRNERFSPNHRPDNIVKSSCDEIHFFGGDDDAVEAELASIDNLSDETPAAAGDGDPELDPAFA